MTDDNVSSPGADGSPEGEEPKRDDEGGVEESTADSIVAGAAGELAEALDERTRDLQRVTAEYHNYRKRVERDKAATAEAATAAVVVGLLPVLDDIDRAREHGDLVGPFASVAEQLLGALTKLGLEVFGTKGDPFDPEVHEAVAHMHSAEVTETSCIDVMRRGYRIGPRLLRAALVAVAEPTEESAAGAGGVVDEKSADEPITIDVEIEEVTGDVEPETAPDAKPDLAADVPDDEEALKAQVVEDAVESAADADDDSESETERAQPKQDKKKKNDK